MDHLLLKAATTAATDEGVFEAVISTATIDRERDIVDPHGMVRALQKWVPTGKLIPLAWNHGRAAADQIGHIDPATAKAVGDEVVASGWVDQSTPVGADAWRLVKSGTLGFSFGYLVLDGAPRKGGGQHIKELDVFEVTATPTPVQNDTRVLSFKQMQESDACPMCGAPVGADGKFNDTQKAIDADRTGKEPKARSVDPLRRQADAVALEHASDGESLRKPPPQDSRKPRPELELSELRRRTREITLTALSGVRE